MISFSRVKGVFLENGSRILKVIQFGAKTADVVSSFGDDSCPLNDMTAIYANTSEVGDSIIIGYINKNQISAVGEKRIFSLKQDESLSTYIHLKNDGTINIGGDSDFMIRYTSLNVALQEEVNKINAELTKIASGISAAGGVYVPTPITLDISASKINEIKTI